MGINSLLQQDAQSAGLAGVDRLARNAMFPQSQMDKTQYAVSSQMPTSAETISADYDTPSNAYTGLPSQPFASGGLASIPRYYDGGSAADEGKVFVGDENSGRWVDPSELAQEDNPLTRNADFQNINIDVDRARELEALKEADPQAYKSQLMSALGDSLKFAYNTNQNYEPIWKQFQSLQEADPAQWHKQQLDWLGHQQGWQIGQNTSERNAAGLPVIQDEIEQAKKAGVSQEEIDNILGTSSQKANYQNQQRIINEQQAGHGPLGMTTQDYATIAAILGSGAAAAYLAPAAGAGGAFVPAAGSGASFAIAPGAYTTAAGGTALGADVFGGLAGTEGAYGGLTAAEQAAQLTGATGSMGPTYAELGYQGANAKSTADAIAAADAASKAAESGITAKQATNLYRGANMLNSAFGGGNTAQAGGGASQAVTAAPTMPTINKFGITGYEGIEGKPLDYRSVMNFAPKTQLSKLKGVPGEYAFAQGGIANLGSYSDGGQLLKGPGDGMSDNIPAKIGQAQPARLADGEFVVPADVVSHLGNGSTDAGAKQLYSMMDKIRKARTGTKKQGKQINASKFLPKG